MVVFDLGFLKENYNGFDSGNYKGFDCSKGKLLGIHPCLLNWIESSISVKMNRE